MLDYLGSVIKSDEEIDNELISYFREYDKDFIENIINDLRRENILPLNNSVSGWMIFVRKFTINKIKEIISEKTRLNKQKLEFMKYIDKNNIDNDIAQNICDMIDSKLIIVNDGTPTG